MSEYDGYNLSPKECAPYLGIGLTSMYRLCADPSFYPAFRIPGINKIFINRNDLDKWIAEQQKANAEENKRCRGKKKKS